MRTHCLYSVVVGRLSQMDDNGKVFEPFLNIKQTTMEKSILKAKQLTNEGHKIFAIGVNEIWYHDKDDGGLRCIYRPKN